MRDLLQKVKAFDLAEILPDVSSIFGIMLLISRIVILIGPAVMLGLGLIYFAFPPKEANHHLGYRSWRSMGSVESWRYAQKICGLLFLAAGLIMMIDMGLLCREMKQMELTELMFTAVRCILVQIGVTVLIFVVVEVLLFIYFDIHGNRKRYRPLFGGKLLDEAEYAGDEDQEEAAYSPYENEENQEE